MPVSRYLEVTYRAGRPMVAYLYLDRAGRSSASARTQHFDGDFVVDFSNDGKPLGVEIISPSLFSLGGLNAVLGQLGVGLATEDEVAALLAQPGRHAA